MSYNYLEKVGSGVFNASGTATVRLGPESSSEWWAPTYTRVSVQNPGVISRPSCTVYRGAPNVYDATSYVDDTLSGVNDVSSVIAGQIVQSSDRITAVFRGGDPGSVALLAVYGRVSNVPPSQGEVLPEVPGTRFVGHLLASESQVILINETFPDIDVLTTLGPFFTGSRPFVGVSITSIGQSATYTLRFWADEALTELLEQRAFSIRVATSGTFTIPALGPWMSFDISPNAANLSANVGLWSTNSEFRDMSTTVTSNLLIAQLNVNIGAGATTVFSGSRVLPGEAVWAVDTAAATWTAVLRSISASGANATINAMRNGANPTSRTVFLPYCNVEAAVTNTTAAAANFTVTLNARPLTPGS